MYLGVPYEYGSMMHFQSRQYSISNDRTIVPLIGWAKLGMSNQASELQSYPTKLDYLHINLLYCEGELIMIHKLINTDGDNNTA